MIRARYVNTPEDITPHVCDDSGTWHGPTGWLIGSVTRPEAKEPFRYVQEYSLDARLKGAVARLGRHTFGACEAGTLPNGRRIAAILISKDPVFDSTEIHLAGFYYELPSTLKIKRNMLAVAAHGLFHYLHGIDRDTSRQIEDQVATLRQEQEHENSQALDGLLNHLNQT